MINQVVFEVEEREDLVPFDEEWEAQRAAQVTFSEAEENMLNGDEEDNEEEEEDENEEEEDGDEDQDEEDDDEVGLSVIKCILFSLISIASYMAHLLTSHHT